MGAGSTMSDDRSGEPDPDAPWRPDFGGWDEHPAAPASRRNAADDAPVAADDRWSRRHDQAEPAPWVLERPPRPARRESAPSGHPVAVVEGLPGPAVTAQLIAVAVVLSAVLLAAGIVTVSLRPVDSAALRQMATLVPERVDELWSHELDAVVDSVAVGYGVVVVNEASSGEISAFDARTGEKLWVRPAVDAVRGIEQLAVVDEAVIVQRRGPTGSPEVIAMDVATGVTMWESDGMASSYTVIGVAASHAVVRRFRLDDRSQLELLDPATGVAAGDAIALSEVSVPGPYMAAEPVEGQVAVWSIESAELGSVAVQSFNLRTIAPWDGTAVALDLDGRIVAFDDRGERSDERPFVSDAFGEFTSRAELAGVVGDGDIGIIASGSSVGFTVIDGKIETVWQRPGRAMTPVATGSGTFSVLVGPDDESGEINATIIDPANGETVVVTDDGLTRETEPLLGDNAYVVAPEIGSSERTLTARRYRSSELWSLELTASAAYEVVDGFVVVVDRAGSMTTIRVFG